MVWAYLMAGERIGLLAVIGLAICFESPVGERLAAATRTFLCLPSW